jgi:poly(A) polymerase
VDTLARSLREAGLSIYESGITALDAYHGVPAAPISFLQVEGSIVDLARAADSLEYPGLFYADAAIRQGGEVAYIRCAESLREAERHSFPVLDLFRLPGTRHFHDPHEVYADLRSPTLALRPAEAERSLFEAAVLLARHDYELPAGFSPACPRVARAEWQHDILKLIMTGRHAERGLALLGSSGFIGAFWPELAGLESVDHAKDMHPEGGGWAHTLETLQHRKSRELSLALGLLLHDAGKVKAESSGAHRFDRHAEIGAGMARRFLARLGFGEPLLGDVAFLVRYHMLPAALPRLPYSRVEDVIGDPRFPLLLELYRCDELSSFRGPEGYFAACATYKSYLKNVRNPWRAADGSIVISRDFI